LVQRPRPEEALHWSPRISSNIGKIKRKYSAYSQKPEKNHDLVVVTRRVFSGNDDITIGFAHKVLSGNDHY